MEARGETGGVSLVAAAAAIVLVVAVAAAARAAAPPAIKAGLVCAVTSARSQDGGRACASGVRGGDAPLVRVSDKPDELRKRLDARLRAHEEHLNRFWRAVLGAQHERPLVEIIPRFLPGYPFTTGLY